MSRVEELAADLRSGLAWDGLAKRDSVPAKVLDEDTRARRFIVVAFLPMMAALLAWVVLNPHWLALPAVVVALVAAAKVSARSTIPGGLLRYSLWIVALGYVAIFFFIGVLLGG